MNKHKQKQGFTIIEVVLVLAIAALIFLMVFMALPALQRSQRDTQRKNDMGRLKTAIDSYKANNRGRLPTELTNNSQPFSSFSFGINYMKADQGKFNDPDGSPYLVRYLPRSSGPIPSGQPHSIFISPGSKCNGEALDSAGGPTNYAIQYNLENGGVYCIDG